MSAGLPVGMMLVGKHYDESTIYRAAHAFEQLGDWRNSARGRRGRRSDGARSNPFSSDSCAGGPMSG